MKNSAKKSTFYYFLRLSEDATATQIKAAYRQIMSENHPDMMTDDMSNNEKQKAKRRCREAQQAIDILGSAPARLRYDALLAAYRTERKAAAAAAAKAKRDKKRSAKRAAADKVVADDEIHQDDWATSPPVLSDLKIDTGDSKPKKRPRVASTIAAMAAGFVIAYAATLWSIIQTVDILLS